MLTNQRVVMSKKGQRIIKAISDYENLKDIFVNFKQGFEEKCQCRTDYFKVISMNTSSGTRMRMI